MVKLWQVVLIGLLLSGCGAGTGAQAAAEGALDGQYLYNVNGCLGCHAVEPGAGYVVGPPMVGQVERAEVILNDPGYTGQAESVEAYIREAILEPNVYINEGYDPIMPATYQSTLTEAQLEAIVDYILTLE